MEISFWRIAAQCCPSLVASICASALYVNFSCFDMVRRSTGKIHSTNRSPQIEKCLRRILTIPKHQVDKIVIWCPSCFDISPLLCAQSQLQIFNIVYICLCPNNTCSMFKARTFNTNARLQTGSGGCCAAWRSRTL